MKHLSPRAVSYLDSLKRDREWSSDRDMVTAYMEKQGLPLIKPLIRFESSYSGLDLTIRLEPNEKFYMRLFSIDDIKDNSEIIYIDNNGVKLFDCGYHETAQYNFYIDEYGQIRVEINDKCYLPLYSSAETMVEIYAFFNSLKETLYSTPYYRISEIDDVLLYLMYDGFNEEPDCSDEQNHILRNGETIVYCNPYWDEGNMMCLRIYSDNKKSCDSLINTLLKEGLIYA